MPLLITIDMLHRFHHYCIQFLPNEIFALLIGYQRNSAVYITNFVHPRIVDASEGHVHADWEDVFRKAQEYYTVGFIHTHPGKNSVVRASQADDKFHTYMSERFMREFGRKPCFLIYAPWPGILSVYDKTEPYKDFKIVD